MGLGRRDEGAEEFGVGRGSRVCQFRVPLDAQGEGVPLDSVRIRPPLPRPINIDCMAVNYMENGTRSEPAPIRAECPRVPVLQRLLNNSETKLHCWWIQVSSQKILLPRYSIVPEIPLSSFAQAVSIRKYWKTISRGSKLILDSIFRKRIRQPDSQMKPCLKVGYVDFGKKAGGISRVQ